MEIIVLKHVSYNKGNKHISFFTKQIGQKFKICNELNFLNGNGKTTIISFDYVNLIDEIPLGENLAFIDVENLKRQLIGRSKNEYKREDRPWLIWNLMSGLNPNDYGLSINEFQKKVEKAKAVVLGINSGEINVMTVYSFMLDCIENIYIGIKNELLESPEKERFERIESKLNNILFECYNNGIRIDSKKTKKYIEQVNIELYEVKNRLQLEFGVFSLYDYENIQSKIVKDFPWFKEIKVNSKEFWDAIKLQKNNSKFINLLYLEKKLTKDKTILMRIGALDVGYINPLLDYFGTITGRILATSPSLQQLNKKYRDIIIPKSEMELVYIDYSQFEAGILAFEAKDLKLIEMYNNKDIYNEISNKLGNETVPRDLAKKIFFCYCYGMSKENILKYSGKNLDLFFKEFPNLEIFETTIFEKFKRDGFIETTLGNRRYKSLINSENRTEGWLISQRIQGTASLILKDVIIEIYLKSKEVEFLLPMHDAVLYQVPKSKVVELTQLIEDSFKSVFKKYCPSLEPKVSNKSFCE
ncbi:DNA polymerase [Flavobacterium inviolabile]|uniref:DNA polymerase n=1 Tax=Flavobacterium inviolabile TaxID=2748320 RepID=UPI0015AAA240|nr:DNA polymerase [Flavobacterium inviolabile]